jgi:hypothetical protein
MRAAHPRPILAALSLIVGVFVFIATGAGAQLNPQEKQRVIATLTSEINRTIQKYQSGLESAIKLFAACPNAHSCSGP